MRVAARKLTEARYSPEALAVGSERSSPQRRTARDQTPGVAAIEQEVEGGKSLQDSYQEALDAVARLRPSTERAR